ncbi:MAG TPA: mechanosensitive ion channel family protein [Stellaceae bacterium]|nr:mechanosensitive ion channel family protein [Stellaceae bacterium]
MIDLQTAAATLRDPLVVALVVFALSGLVTHLLFRRHPVRRAIVRVVFLVVLTILLIHAGVVPYQPLRMTNGPFRDVAHAILKIAWWLWSAWFVVGILRAFVVTEHRSHDSKLIQDLLAGLVYLAALFAIIAYVFDLPVKGLLATSGAIAIILGLALQSTLSDVFSGIVLNFSRPYRPGDWISIDGTTDGRVIEMNWRATHVLTAKRDLAIVPNSAIAKAKLVNSSSPSGIHGLTVTIELDTAALPAAGAEILEQAILNSRLILATPAPSITIKSITASAIEYDISVFVEELGQSTRAQNELFDYISRHLAAAGIALASSQSVAYPALPIADLPSPRKTRVERVFDLLDLFVGLNAAERKTLAGKTTQRHYEKGEVLVEPGEVLHSLYMIGSGVVSLSVMASEGEIELMRLGPGDHYGEVGLLTGHATAGRLSALTPVTIYELAKEDLAPVLEARPEVSHELCRALARRQAAGQLIASPEIDTSLPANRVAGWFSDRLHRLFDLASTE